MNMKSDFENIHMSQRTPSSREEVVGQKFIDKANASGLNLSVLETDEQVVEALKQNRMLLGPNASLDTIEIVRFLREMGAVLTPEQIAARKKAQEKPVAVLVPEPEFIPVTTDIRLTEVYDETLEDTFSSYRQDENSKAERDAVIDSDDGISELYRDIMDMRTDVEAETDEYYMDFQEVGYSKKEIEQDLRALKNLEKIFETKTNDGEQVRTTKEIATMTEVALEYGVSKLGWYGDRVKVIKASQFDDVLNGIDGILEVIDPVSESNFLGLGIDVTFRGLRNEQYKKKINKLLEDVRSHKPKQVKYFKDHRGESCKKFTIPTMVLSFHPGDVRNLVYMLKRMSESGTAEKFKQHPIKFEIMNQIITQCHILGAFAERHGNPISEKYAAMLSSIEILGKENKEIAAMLSVRRETPVSKRIREIIHEFESSDSRIAA